MINSACQTDVELEQVWLNAKDMAHAGIARASIINRDTKSERSQRRQRLEQSSIVGDRSMLGDLQDDAAKIDTLEH